MLVCRLADCQLFIDNNLMQFVLFQFDFELKNRHNGAYF